MRRFVHGSLPAFTLLALIAARAAAQPPTAQADAASALRRWTDAIAAPRAEARPGVTLVRGDVTESGIPGTTKFWIDGTSRRRLTTLRARAREEVTRDGGAWAKDWNGKVEALAGRDRRDAATRAAIDALMFTGAVAEVARACAAILIEAGDAKSGVVLRFTPRDGEPFDVVLDGTTGLPSKIVRKPDEDEIVVVPSDWRIVGAVRIPFSVKETQGDKSENTLVVRKVTRSGRGAVRFERPADGPPDYRFARGTSTSIPFDFETDHFMVKGRVNGSKELWFMIDTGADATILNAPRLGDMGVRSFGATSVTGGGGSAGFAYADVARLEIGGLALLGQRAGVMDLHGLEKIYGMPMGGLLGYDFLSRVVMRVDYDAGTIDLLEPSSFAYAGRGTRVPFVLEGGEPHVVAKLTVPTVPAFDAELIVDCGAAGTVNLNSPFVKAHRLLELARTAVSDAPNTFAGSEKEFFAQTLVRGRLQAFALGPFDVKDVPTSLMVGTTGAYAASGYAGTMGQGMLRRFNTVYDYSRSTMILEPNARFPEPFPKARAFGVTILSDGPGYKVFTITGVQQNSPAEASGLRKGDVIAAVDGKPASVLRLTELRRLLSEDGAHRRIEVRRGGESVSLDVTIQLAASERM